MTLKAVVTLAVNAPNLVNELRDALLGCFYPVLALAVNDFDFTYASDCPFLVQP